MKQMPEPTNGMSVYNIKLLKSSNDAWRAVAYMTDKHGRMWAAELQLTDTPSLALGEEVFPHELREE